MKNRRKLDICFKGLKIGFATHTCEEKKENIEYYFGVDNSTFSFLFPTENVMLCDVEKSLGNMINNYHISRNDNAIILNGSTSFLSSDMVYLYEELIYHLPLLMEGVNSNERAEYLVLDDSYKAINVYNVLKIDRFHYSIITPVPSRMNYDDNGQLVEYVEKNNYSIRLIIGKDNDI
jgi:hypothetical protein